MQSCILFMNLKKLNRLAHMRLKRGRDQTHEVIFFSGVHSVLNIRDFVLCSEHLNVVALTVSKENLQSLRLFSFGCNSVPALWYSDILFHLCLQ